VAIQHGENTWNVKFKDEEILHNYNLPDWALDYIEAVGGSNREEGREEQS
jgi:hypothetical protein